MRPDLSWSPSPAILLACALAAGVYVRRWLRVRRGRSPQAAAQAPVWRLLCALAAVAAVIGALVSPLDALADQLFFMHMIQHVLLLDIIPILAIVSLTKVLMRPATRRYSCAGSATHSMLQRSACSEERSDSNSHAIASAS